MVAEEGELQTAALLFPRTAGLLTSLQAAARTSPRAAAG